MAHVKRPARVAWFAAALSLAIGAGCSPKLVVRHDDPLSGPLQVSLDRGSPRELEFGDRTSWRVRPGAHLLRVLDRARESAAWDSTDEGILVVIERSAIFTLLPPNVAAPVARSEATPGLRKSERAPVVETRSSEPESAAQGEALGSP